MVSRFIISAVALLGIQSFCFGAAYWVAYGGKDPMPTEKPTVAKICRDGSHIFHYKDGTYRTAWNYVVDDPEKVCDKK